ncbi:RNA polymerase factor sigma-54 [Chryseosolibacter indicus]|uniref:RNA polymerase factor sigma-54 n=1 Tax=Chryseosolibacter indicus TaxID=2782351 RepID=A0ABS5VNS8_9BACT|nr:RNA polymerase factor sigma-54 [Chryseosolibacter indicus]MBT1702424.1 RNA polymerase factor sigma-54 [Chryseosolibacter indicus]
MLYQNLTQKQQLKIHPQHLQMLQLLHLNTIELEQRIQNELEENPLIEEKADEDSAFETGSQDTAEDYKDYEEYCYDDTPDYKLENAQHFQSQAPIEKPLVEMEDFRHELKNQLALYALNEQETEIGHFIIDSLTDEGFLEFSIEGLADDYSLKFNKWIEPDLVQKLIKIIQQLEPVGVATGNIKECLILQLRRMQQSPDVKLAIRILDNYYNELMHRNFERIINELKIDEEDLKDTFHLLGTLKLKPVTAATSSPQTETILPDFILIQEDDQFQVMLARERSSKLSISSSWKKMVYDTEKSGTDNRSKQYLKSKLNAAEWFVNAIRQRENTMLKVMEAIVRIQQDYFEEGDITKLKPMILKNVADMVGVDISTVSRITCNKYVQTHFGNVLLKSLFTEGIANHKGEVVSNKVIQQAIQEVIQAEDKRCPYSDQQLVKVLAKRGFEIARRTVTKYREQLHIPAAQMRAFLA